MERVAELLIERKQPTQPLIVGISGIDASGKTTLALQLSALLQQRGQAAQVLQADDYHLPREVRSNCSDSPPECYYRHTFDWPRLISLLMIVRATGRLQGKIPVLDWVADNYSVWREYRILPDTVVLLEGVFLFQPRLLPLLDYRIWVEISPEECLRRVVQRDGPLFGDQEQMRARYLSKYLPGQAIHLADCLPLQVADLVIDNENPLVPAFSFHQ